MTGHDLPAEIGPHEGREFTLMRDGKKNVALFFEVAPEGLDDILSEGFNLLLFRQFEHQGCVFFTRIVFRDGHEGAAMRLKDLVQRDSAALDPAREHEIGEILSYTRDQVDAFIAHALSCRTMRSHRIRVRMMAHVICNLCCASRVRAQHAPYLRPDAMPCSFALR